MQNPAESKTCQYFHCGFEIIFFTARSVQVAKNHHMKGEEEMTLIIEIKNSKFYISNKI